MKFLVLHGPNLNMLGLREPSIYGRRTLEDIDAAIGSLARVMGHHVRIEQHNGEGALVDAIQRAWDDVDGIIINPAGYTHTSVALRDALLSVGLPAVEVHLTNPDARESFRRRSLLADVVLARIAGFGMDSYLLALRGLVAHFEKQEQPPPAGQPDRPG